MVTSVTPEAVADRLQEVAIREKSLLSPTVDVQAIRRYGAFVGSEVENHSTLPRAMDHAREEIRAIAGVKGSVVSGKAILADTMSKSKGRFSRQWHAPLGGLWGCLVHGNTLLPQSRRFIPLAVGLACCEAVHEIGGGQATLRWVNDVLVEGRKLAGFLVESFTEPTLGEEFTLVGFGININNSSFPGELAASSLALKDVLGKDVDLGAFTTLFLARLAWNFGLLYYEEALELRGDQFSGNGGQHLLLERWLACSDTVGQRVIYGFDVMTAPQYQAEVIAVDRDGGLVMRLDDGHQKTEYCGEVRYLSS